MTEQAATNVSLIAGSPLPSQQVIVLRALQRLGQTVPTSRWCLIGGLMVKNALDPHKHLQDAAALLTVSRLPEFSEVSNAVRKRLTWLYTELADQNSIGWEYVAVQPRNDAIARLSTALGIGV